MKKKTLFWILGIVIVTLVVLVGGKKAGMFGMKQIALFLKEELKKI